MALAITVVGGVMWSRVTDFNLTAHKATWWLIANVREGTGRASMDAREELAARMKAGKVPIQQAREVVAAALKIQPDRTHPMGDGLGDFVQLARRKQQGVSDEQWEQFWAQAWDVQVRVGTLPDLQIVTRGLGSTARVFDDVRYGSRVGSPRVWQDASVCTLTGFELDDERFDGPFAGRTWHASFGFSGPELGGQFVLAPIVFEGLTDGQHTIKMEIEIHVGAVNPDGSLHAKVNTVAETTFRLVTDVHR